MLLVLIASLIAGCAAQYNDAEWLGARSGVKGGVKGGGGYNPYYPGLNNNTYRQEGGYNGYAGYVTRFNMTQNNSQFGSGYNRSKEFREVGVCYIEVPTASLVRDPAHIPVGNGSRPDLSRIRSCCKGYRRNIELFMVCDPVCDPECVNGACIAPNACSCFPDHIRNLGGFCMPTCPIGCQNGRCSGGECLCNPGYTLDADGKFCKPVCAENCGGTGNCTEPNTCDCKSDYQATSTGNCKPVCRNQCRNGDCVAPNQCRCKPGYRKNPQDAQGQCEPECPQGCPNGRCIAPNVCDPPRTTSGSPYYPTYQPNNPLNPDGQVRNASANPNQTYPGQYPGQSGYQGQTGSYGQSGYQGSGQAGYYGQRPTNPGQPGSASQFYPGYPGQQQFNADGQRDCSNKCINGVCVEGNTCRCNQGYVLDPNDASGLSCIPYCPGGCPNGVCTAPSFCICNAGYRKDNSVKGRSTCVKRIRRSVEDKTPEDIASLIAFNIPEY